MFDPEKVKTAAILQRRCTGWVVFWSPALRAFTAIAGFVPDQAVVINEPFTHDLLRRIGAIELAVSVGAPIDELIDMGARHRAVARPATGFAAGASRAVRPHKPRGRYAPGGGHAPSRGADSTGWVASVAAPPGVPAASVTADPAGAPSRAGLVGRAVRAFIPRHRSVSAALIVHSQRSANA